MLTTHIGRLRAIGMLEGASFLLLLFVAMPLKYMMDMPLAVRVAGMGHGILFLTFLYALITTASEHSWPPARWAAVLAAALLPFGPFAIDRRLRGWAGQNDTPT